MPAAEPFSTLAIARFFLLEKGRSAQSTKHRCQQDVEVTGHSLAARRVDTRAERYYVIEATRRHQARCGVSRPLTSTPQVLIDERHRERRADKSRDGARRRHVASEMLLLR